MKRDYNLECEECGKGIKEGKKVCLLKINDEVVSDPEYGVISFKFCSKKCALNWLNKNVSFEFLDEKLFGIDD